MTEEKECGYKVGYVYFHKLKGFKELWNSTDVATKDMIVNEVGALVKKLHLHNVSRCEGCERGLTVCDCGKGYNLFGEDKWVCPVCGKFFIEKQTGC